MYNISGAHIMTSSEYCFWTLTRLWLISHLSVTSCYTLVLVDADAAAPDLAPVGGHSDWPAVPGHRQRVVEGLQQRRLPLLLHALPHVHRAHAHRAHL